MNMIKEEEKNDDNNMEKSYKIRILQDKNKKVSILDIDKAIMEKNLEKIIIIFSKMCYYIDTNKLLGIQYKRNIDIIFFKTKEIKTIFEEINNPEKISNLILYCIKNNILSQIYLYIIVSQIIFEKDNSKAEELINIINKLYSSVISSYNNYSLVIFFLSYYIIINTKEFLNYIDIKKAMEFLVKIINQMNNSIIEYKIISKQLFDIKFKKESDNVTRRTYSKNITINQLIDDESNEYIENELNMFSNFLIEILNITINDINKMDKFIFKEQLFDTIANCIIYNKNNNIYYNQIMLDYILNKIKIEYLIVFLDKIYKLLKSIIIKKINVLAIVSEIISKIYLLYTNNINNKEIINDINNYFLNSFNDLMLISKEDNVIENLELTFYLNYIKNILVFIIQITEQKSNNERIEYINSVLNLFLNFLQKNKNKTIQDEDFFLFSVIYQHLKIINIGLIEFKPLIEIISLFPSDKKKIQFGLILDEISKSKIWLDNKNKVRFAISLINNILVEINDNELDNFEITQTIVKINKIILYINHEDPKELLNLILLLGENLSKLNDFQKSLTSNSFYQILINISHTLINLYISKKNNKNDNTTLMEYGKIYILLTNVYSYMQEYITTHFQYLFDDNKRIILEIIVNIDKIKNQELKEKLAHIAVEFGLLYIKLILKEKALETEKTREEIEQYYNIDEFDFDYDDKEEEEEMNESDRSLRLKINKSLRSQKENDLLIENIKKELEKKSKNQSKIKNFSDSFSLVIKSTKKFVNVFIKTTIFNILIDKDDKDLFKDDNNNQNISQCSFDSNLDEEKKEDSNILDSSIKEIETNDIEDNGEIENKEKNNVPGYSILFEEFSKIKGKRIDLALIKLCLIDMYYYIKDIIKVNSLFLEVIEEASFLNNDFENFGIIALILEKVIWFINHDKNALERKTMCTIITFTEKRINNYTKNKKHKNNYCEKLEKELNIIREKKNKIVKYLNERNKSEDNNN